MDAVLTCLVDEKLGPGEMNARLSKAVCDFFCVSGAVALRSPEFALLYAFRALAIEPPRKIMLSALAPSWQFCALKSFGFEPILLDVDEKTGAISFQNIQNEMKKGANVLILGASFGNVPSLEEIEKIASLNLIVIEDVSQAAGATIFYERREKDLFDEETLDESSAKKAGTIGVFSILSLEECDSITGGGGAVLLAPKNREWTVLNRLVQNAPKTHLLSDLNAALAFVGIREFAKNEKARRFLFEMYAKSLLNSQNRENFTFSKRKSDVVLSFPVVLFCDFEEAKLYATKKGIQIVRAFEDCALSRYAKILDEENGSISAVDGLTHAKSLFLRTAIFPLYPRLHSEYATKISKILATLP